MLLRVLNYQSKLKATKIATKNAIPFLAQGLKSDYVNLWALTSIRQKVTFLPLIIYKDCYTIKQKIPFLNSVICRSPGGIQLCPRSFLKLYWDIM